MFRKRLIIISTEYFIRFDSIVEVNGTDKLDTAFSAVRGVIRKDLGLQFPGGVSIAINGCSRGSLADWLASQVKPFCIEVSEFIRIRLVIAFGFPLEMFLDCLFNYGQVFETVL